MASHPVGALVLGGDYQGLGIVRSVGGRGVPVCVVDDERSIARFSRYSTSSARVPGLGDDESTIASLLELGRSLGVEGWVLYATRDETVAALSRHRDRLSQHFRVPVPPWETFRQAWDKRCTYALASALGIPVPRTWDPRSPEELEAIDASQPLAIKPAVKPRFLKATKAKAWRAEGAHELRDRFVAAVQAAGGDPVMVQELIPGGGARQFAYCAFFKGRRAIGSMVVRRARQHPHDFGRASTFVETVELPELEAMGERFLGALDFYGLAEVEFKFDERSHEYKLLDFNARTWGYHSLGAHAGPDFAYMLYADQVGLEPAPRRAPAGKAWMRLLTDLPTAVLDIRGGRLTAREYLRSLRSCDVEAVFSHRDPLPGLAELALVPYLYVKRGF